MSPQLLRVQTEGGGGHIAILVPYMAKVRKKKSPKLGAGKQEFQIFFGELAEGKSRAVDGAFEHQLLAIGQLVHPLFDRVFRHKLDRNDLCCMWEREL